MLASKDQLASTWLALARVCLAATQDRSPGSWVGRMGDPESTPAKSIPCGCSLPVLTRFGRPGRVGPSRLDASNDAVQDFRRAQAPR